MTIFHAIPIVHFRIRLLLNSYLSAYFIMGTNLIYFFAGFSKVQATMRNGRRCSAAKAFLKSILSRPNLHISVRTRVTKIIIDTKTNRAVGVEFYKNKTKYRVNARKEVILSAGSINSPQLLMLSGIGPSDELERLGIPVIQSLKVGYNFQDHMAMSTLAFLVNQSSTVSDLSVQNPEHIFNYLTSGKYSEYFFNYLIHVYKKAIPVILDIYFE